MITHKKFNVRHNIGRAKYVLNFHDGEKTHADGSQFYDMKIFKNKVDLKNNVEALKNQGYVENK
jgi:hypothetical protein